MAMRGPRGPKGAAAHHDDTFPDTKVHAPSLRSSHAPSQQWNDNDCGWNYDPSEGRDHKRVLELPANIEEIDQERKCSWLKKQYKKLARKWHPDKAKGNAKVCVCASIV
eukprot:COSAG01_NODE_2256_length_8067_cov_5.797691_13_plen_109_part_00